MEPTAPASSDATRILPPDLLSELEAICFRSANEESRRERLVRLLSHNTGHDEAIRGFLRGLEVSFPGEPEVRQIGPYRILSELGRGGFGEVYLAEQEVPVRRRVALKVLKLGMDSRAILARFAREQASLARMNHDAVAKIFDAGTTPQGQSFFAMELVDGQPITRYCDEHRLDLRQRIELFQRVCLGVQHAHQKGVVHRDLKPGNVLVAKVGDLHEPKLIDFGIARAIEGDDAEAGLTETGMVLGTPAYMAPEQAKGDPSLVDTRTDVYALGAILYELLTGSQPLVGGGTETSWDLWQRILAAETPRPSVRVAVDTTTLGQRAQQRRTAPSTWLRSLRGDLDWIVLKAMAKAAEDRYASAAEMAADLGRYLRQEPVLAGPPSAMYRLRKFVRRYRGQVVAGAAVVVTAVVGAAFAVNYAIVANENAARASGNEAKANRRAEENAKLAEEKISLAAAEQKAKEQALQNARETAVKAAQLQQVADFQSSQLSGIDAELMGARLRRAVVEATKEDQRARVDAGLTGVNFTNLALEVLNGAVFERGLAAIERDFAAQPQVKAQLLQTVATTLFELGLMKEAMAPQQKAVEIRRQVLGEDHPDTLVSCRLLAQVLRFRSRLTESESLLRDTVARSRAVLGDDHAVTQEAVGMLGSVLKEMSRLPEAETLLREAVEYYRRHDEAKSNASLTSGHDLALLLKGRRSYDEAERLYREVLAGQIVLLGIDHPHTLTTRGDLGLLLQATGRLVEAEAMTREVLDAQWRVLGEDHWEYSQSLNNLAVVLQSQGRHKDAELYFRQALAKREALLGPSHLRTIVSVFNLGRAKEFQGLLPEAEVDLRTALERARGALGPNHELTLAALTVLSSLCERQGKWVDAETLLTEVVTVRRHDFGEDAVETLAMSHRLALATKQLGKFEEAETMLQHVLSRRRRVLGPEHLATSESANSLAVFLLERNRPAEAEPLLREIVESSSRVLGVAHAKTIAYASNLGDALAAQGKFAEAERFAREAMEVGRRELGDDHPSTALAMATLGDLLRLQGCLDEAEPYLRMAMDKRRKVLGEHDPVTISSIGTLAVLLSSRGEFAEAETLMREALDLHRAVSGRLHLNALRALRVLAKFYKQQKRPTESEACFRELFEARRGVSGESHPQTLVAALELSEVLLALRQWDATIVLLGPMESAMRRQFGERNMQKLADCLVALGFAHGSRNTSADFVVGEAFLIEAYLAYDAGGAALLPDVRASAAMLVQLYRSWAVLEPGKGYDLKGQEWEMRAAVVGAGPK